MIEIQIYFSVNDPIFKNGARKNKKQVQPDDLGSIIIRQRLESTIPFSPRLPSYPRPKTRDSAFYSILPGAFFFTRYIQIFAEFDRNQ